MECFNSRLLQVLLQLKFDIKTAFLYEYLDKEIYMKLSERFENTNKIYKLQKAIHGAK